MAEIKGGEKMQAILKEMAKNMEAGELQVGFLEGATYPDGTPVAQVAFWAEFGTKTAPARPFFRTLISEKSDEWADDFARGAKSNKFNTEQILNIMGDKIRGQVQESITKLVEPKLSPITLMLRKMKSDNPNLKVTGKIVAEAAAKIAAGESYSGVSTKPLVESGHMLASVDFVVKK